MEKYVHAKKRFISENTEEGPVLKSVRCTENPDLEEINGVTDIAKILANDPMQPDLKSYPKRKFGREVQVISEGVVSHSSMA